MHRFIGRAAASVALLVLSLLTGGSSVSAARDEGLPQFGGLSPDPPVVTVPFFSDSFGFGGATYRYTMVGRNPRTSDDVTVVPTVIVPLRFVFADGNVASPGATVQKALLSPLFVPTQFVSGFTQYGDAVRRAMFWQYVANTDYHVLLAPTRVLETQTLIVPAGEGVFLPSGSASGPPSLGLHVTPATGVVSTTWFGFGQTQGAFQSLAKSLRLSPTALVIFVSRNVVLSTPPVPYGSPVAGFHSVMASTNAAGITQLQTLIWADYADPNIIVELPDVTSNSVVLSHEVSEWLHDPFLNNQVPTWISPFPLSSALFGCQGLLETGDPLAEVSVTVNGYRLQDEAFLSWFAKQSPSIGINGQYSFLGAFKQPSPVC